MTDNTPISQEAREAAELLPTVTEADTIRALLNVIGEHESQQGRTIPSADVITMAVIYDRAEQSWAALSLLDTLARQQTGGGNGLLRETLVNACDFIEAMIDANDYVGTGSGKAAELEEREDRESLAEFRAALSAPPTDEGVSYGERVEYEERVLATEMTLERHKRFLVAKGWEERPFASCCAEGGGSVDGCDCVNKDHGFAFHQVAPSHPTDEVRALSEALKLTPMIEAITPTPEEWKRCETIQDTYDLMKRRIDIAFGERQQ